MSVGEDKKCSFCHGSGFVACRSRDGQYAFAGPVPDDAKGYFDSDCWCCDSGPPPENWKVMKVGSLVRFYSEKNGGPVHRIADVKADGMVELEDMAGYFAPHFFDLADDIGDIPLSCAMSAKVIK